MTSTQTQTSPTSAVRPTQDASRACMILRLPDEILCEIIKYSVAAAGARPQWFDPYYARRPELELSEVCRRFNRIVTPALYRDVTVNIGDPRNYTCASNNLIYQGHMIRTQQLARTLREKPELRPFTRDLVMHEVSGDDVQGAQLMRNCRTAQDIMYYLTGVKSFTFLPTTPGAFDNRWDVVRSALNRFQDLSELNIYDPECQTIDLVSLCRAISTADVGPKVKVLDLVGVSQDGGRSEAKRISLQQQPGKGPFTNLRIRGFQQTPEALSAFLTWPEKLEAFTFQQSLLGRGADTGLHKSWSLGTLMPALEHHKKTLRYLRISHLSLPGLQDFDLSEFTALETLHIPLATTSTCRTDIRNLVAPNLKSLIIDMSNEEATPNCGETLSTMTPKVQDFILALADAFKGPEGQSRSLEEINIIYNPEPWFTDADDITPAVYPWDRFDTIAHKVRPAGIKVAYSAPCISREDYAEEVERAVALLGGFELPKEDWLSSSHKVSIPVA